MATTDALQDADPRDVEAPRGRTSLPTMVLMLLNLAGLTGYGYILYMDMVRQEQWARAVYMRHLYLVGLPVDDRQLGSNDTDPEHGTELVHSLDPPLIKEAYAKRGVNLKGRILEVKEILRHNIRYPVEQGVLDKYFADAKAGKAVGTLKEELDRVKGKLPGDIDRVAGDVAKNMSDKGDEAKRQLVRDNLFPTAVEGWQIMSLDDKGQAIGLEAKIRQASGKDLDSLIVDAAKRKMLYDILKPMEVFRPSEPDADLFVDVKEELTKRNVKKPLLDRVTDLVGAPTGELLKLLDKRFDDVIADYDWIIKKKNDDPQQRGNAEKRRAIAFLLLAISQVELPGGAIASGEAPKKDAGDKKVPGKQPDDGKGGMPKQPDEKGMVKFVAQDDPEKDKVQPPAKPPEPSIVKERPPRTFAFADAENRVEVVVGLHHFNQACTDLAIVIEIMQKQMVTAILRDRGEYTYPTGSRIHDPVHFSEQLIKVMKQLKLNFVSEEQFKQDLEKRLKDVQGKIRSSEELLPIIYQAMDQRVVIVEDPEDLKVDPATKVKRTQFESAVVGVLDGNAPGWLAKYQAAVRRIQDLAGVIEVRKREFAELQGLKAEQEAQLDTRDKYEKKVFKNLIDNRERTQDQARKLQRLQQELFLAQVDLVGAHDYNLYLERRLRDLERKLLLKAKGGKGK